MSRKKMNRINEFNFEPGVYLHYKGTLYVAQTIVTHADNPTTGKMELLQDPMVVYRDLTPVMKHVNGKIQQAHHVYMRSLTEFRATVADGVKRFTQQ